MAKKKARKKAAKRRKPAKRKASKRRARARRYGPEREPCRIEGTTLVCLATPSQARAFARREKRRARQAQKAASGQNRSMLKDWFSRTSSGEGLDGRRRKRRRSR